MSMGRIEKLALEMVRASGFMLPMSTALAKAEALIRSARCENCGSAVKDGSRCVDCNWQIGRTPANPDAPLCSICRRRHDSEITHGSE